MSIREIAEDSKVVGIHDSLEPITGHIRLSEEGTCSLAISKDLCGYDHVCDHRKGWTSW